MGYQHRHHQLDAFVRQKIRQNEEYTILNKWVVYNIDTQEVTIKEPDDSISTSMFFLFKGTLTELITQDIIDRVTQKMDEEYGL